MNVKEGTRRLAVLLGVIGCAVGCYASYGATGNLWKVRQFESLMALPVTREIEKLAKDFQASTRPRVSTIDLETLKKLPQGHKDELDLLIADLPPPPPPGFVLDEEIRGKHTGALKKLPQGHKDELDLLAEELKNAPPMKKEFDPLPGVLATAPPMRAPAREFGGVVRPSPDFKPKSLPKTLPPDFFDGRTPESSEFVSERDSAKAQGRGLLTVVANRDGIRNIMADSNGDIQQFSLSTGETVSRPKTGLLMSLLLVTLYPMLGFALPWGTLRSLAWVIAGFTAPLPQ